MNNKMRMDIGLRVVLGALLMLAISVGALPANASAAPSEYGLTWPLIGHTSASSRSDDGGAIDISASKGTEVLASADGYVTKICRFDRQFTPEEFNLGTSKANLAKAGLTTTNTWGNVVMVYHPAIKKTTLYAHLSEIKVSEGQSVSQGDVIGLSGNTGRTTSYGRGWHLHYEVHLGNDIWGRNKVRAFNYVNAYNQFEGNVTPSCANPIPEAQGRDEYNKSTVSFRTPADGAAIYYTLDGQDPNSGNWTRYWGPISLPSGKTTCVKAIAVKDGCNNSDVVTGWYSFGQMAEPQVVVSQTGDGALVSFEGGRQTVCDSSSWDNANAEIWYTIDGSNPAQGKGMLYTGAFLIKQNTQVRAISVAKGEANSRIHKEQIVCEVPAVPVVSASSSKVAQNTAATFSWNADSSAASYEAKLYFGGEQVASQTVTTNSVTFTLEQAGTYEVRVSSSNFVGASEDSAAVSVESMAPSKVTFVSNVYDGLEPVKDGQGNYVYEVIDSQMVDYNGSARKPATPKKEHFVWTGWEGSYNHVTGDTTIVAQWEPVVYRVSFYAEDGTTLLSRQNVTYTEAASEPDPGQARTGYVFAGWSVVSADDGSACDFKHVDSNMKLRAVFTWENNDLPVVAQIGDNGAFLNGNGNYQVNVVLTNYPKDATTALLRVALKTSDGKLVQTARETVELDKDGSWEGTITLKYQGDFIAKVAEVEVVGFDGNYRTGGAYSQAVSANILASDSAVGYEYGDWSEWSTEKPENFDELVAIGAAEAVTEYSSRDKQTTTSTSESLDGWSRDGSATTTYGAWSGDQTAENWTPAASDTVRVTSGATWTHHYYHWCNKYSGHWNQDSIAYGSSSEYHELYLNYELPRKTTSIADKGGNSEQYNGPGCKWNWITYWHDWSSYKYTYQTRSKTTTYGFYRWGDWSDWSTDAVSATASREVQTRVVYRTRSAKEIHDVLSGAEDTTGTKQHVEGKLDVSADFSGRLATVMVYCSTNTDPNEDQLMYIGQTTIGEGNTYSFDFIPRQDPSILTGDFIVSLGIEGANGLVNVGVIKAPRNEFTVTYQYQDASGKLVVLSEQKVAEGSDAVVPDAPEVEGYVFRGWSASGTRVYGDMVITGLYAPVELTVSWVDWANKAVVTQVYKRGDALVAPESPEAAGLTFKGWDALMDGTTTVEKAMAINAVYEKKTYKVTFLNGDGSALDTQTVYYGDSASLPSSVPTKEGMVFTGWDAGGAWLNVTKDVEVQPTFAYAQTASTPVMTADVVEGYVGPQGAKVYLATPTDGATILYTVDDTDPLESGVTYDASMGIVVTSPVTLRAVATADGMNPSSVLECELDVTATNDLAHATLELGADVFAYSGTEIEPLTYVYLGGVELVRGVDYLYGYKNNNAIGTATVTVIGIGDYTGRLSLDFELVEPLAPEPRPEALAIVSQPADASAPIGQKATFTVEATGDGLSYQWQWRNANATNWSKCTSASGEGFDTASLTTVVNAAKNGRQYRCIVTDSNGERVVSSVATLSVDASVTPLSIVSQPASQSVSVNDSVTFTVGVKGGEAPVSYRWQWRSNDTAKWNNCTASSGEGYDSASLAVTAYAARNGRQFRCVVSDASGTKIESTVATLNVGAFGEKLAITGQPADVSAVVGAKATFTVSAKGESVAYQWQWRSNDAAKWNNCTASSGEGYDSASLTVTAYAARNGRQFRCVVSDATGARVESDVATLTVGEKTTASSDEGLSNDVPALDGTQGAPTQDAASGSDSTETPDEPQASVTLEITKQPENVTAAPQGDAVFKIEVVGSDVTYKWQWRNPGQEKWNDCTEASGEGFDKAELKVKAYVARDGREFRCVLVDAMGNKLESDVVKLTVEAQEEQASQPETDQQAPAETEMPEQPGLTADDVVQEPPETGDTSTEGDGVTAEADPATADADEAQGETAEAADEPAEEMGEAPSDGAFVEAQAEPASDTPEVEGADEVAADMAA